MFLDIFLYIKIVYEYAVENYDLTKQDTTCIK